MATDYDTGERDMRRQFQWFGLKDLQRKCQCKLTSFLTPLLSDKIWMVRNLITWRKWLSYTLFITKSIKLTWASGARELLSAAGVVLLEKAYREKRYLSSLAAQNVWDIALIRNALLKDLDCSNVEGKAECPLKGKKSPFCRFPLQNFANNKEQLVMQ